MESDGINTLTIVAIVSLICSILLSLSVLTRFAAKYARGSLNHESNSFFEYLRDNWHLIFGAFERRAIGFGILLALCSILQLVLSIDSGKAECVAQSESLNVYPVLLWISTVVSPAAHLIFVLPSIFASTRAVYECEYSLTPNSSHHPLVMTVLKFSLSFLAFAALVIVLWLPVYILYINDASINGTCFWNQNSILYFMGKSTSIAACTVLGLTILAIVSGIIAAFIHSVVYKVRSRKAGYRLASYSYMICGVISIVSSLYPSSIFQI